MIREKQAHARSGVPLLVFYILLLVAALWGLIASARGDSVWGALGMGFLIGLDAFMMAGLFIVHPNQAQVIQLFGNYVGSQKVAGLWWMNPLCSKKRVSLRVRNFESSKLKVNDRDGNPIEIETAEAIFEVDNYEDFVHVQSEAAVRNLATGYPYDQHEEGEKALRSHTSEIADRMKAEIQERLAQAGVEVLEARISHLAYAPEIASAMLQRQQATAVVAARSRIVEGAVGMVEMALDALSRKDVVQLDEERKAAMVSNLLVVLCSDRSAAPVVNTGSLYQ
jgi:regulator of protease activity HflC (stomatin/prohibitin superfamily)